MSKISPFEQALINSMDWMREVQEELDLDEQNTYECLRAVLQALRDRLPVAEAATLGGKLPMVVRGIFYGGWTPARSVDVSGEDFLGDVANMLQNADGLEADPEQVARSVLRVLGRRLPKPDLDLIAEASPAMIRELLAA
ncbi:DUF2267 domain-containing protein [Desulfocurvibacter africanus]|uniref:DUF2267 domain-containing protein n=1 Tax=Desulfocurvibacter africanus subsp. africanus str. Walvis Bay TaxID=690850 RepID=F3YX45_DESAF|nr:DUF2267 domain-containing protein [Desulfocurvibacter africanus]EGJ49433.1 hypothetical protein Desaf_1090 [Desulfocurvibacter africanus subsp. africanus str. Walvis Bay]